MASAATEAAAQAAAAAAESARAEAEAVAADARAEAEAARKAAADARAAAAAEAEAAAAAAAAASTAPALPAWATPRDFDGEDGGPNGLDDDGGGGGYGSALGSQGAFTALLAEAIGDEGERGSSEGGGNMEEAEELMSELRASIGHAASGVLGLVDEDDEGGDDEDAVDAEIMGGIDEGLEDEEEEQEVEVDADGASGSAAAGQVLTAEEAAAAALAAVRATPRASMAALVAAARARDPEMSEFESFKAELRKGIEVRSRWNVTC